MFWQNSNQRLGKHPRKLCFSVWILVSALSQSSGADLDQPADRALSIPANQSRSSKLHVISGLVVSEVTGQAVSNALVRASTTALDLTRLNVSLPGMTEARTDTAGRFKLELASSQTLSVNVFAAGYEEAARTWNSGENPCRNMDFATAEREGLRIKLHPALYVAGIVVDELKRPIPEVSIEATMRSTRGYSYLEFENTDSDGRFELFDFPLTPNFDGNTNAQGQVTFDHPDTLRTIMRNVYVMPEQQRTNVRITLLKGHEISGVVRSATGQLVTGLLVEAVPGAERAARKSALTDAQGHFTLRGIQGNVVVTAHSLDLNQKAQESLTVSGQNLQLALQLSPIVYTNPPKRYSLFGMTLANVTPEIQRAYDLPSETGVVILDPGKNHFRLGIGTLAEGESFWIVGERGVRDLREMILEIVRISSIEPPGNPNEGCRGRVRVVYRYPLGGGTNTQFLTLNQDDLQELMALLATMP
jgi:hypothetical protein